MRTMMLALAGATALTAASAANSAVSVGTSGGTNGTTSALVTDPIGNPNKLEFDTTNGSAGSFTSFFNFFSDSSNLGVLSATTATYPASTVSLLQLFTGGNATTAGTMPVPGGSISGSGNSLTLTSALLPNTWYTFTYSGTLTTAGNVSGPASFYTMPAVPEPASWALMLVGFAGVGVAMRRRRRRTLAQLG